MNRLEGYDTVYADNVVEIKRIARRHAGRHGGDPDELFGEANLAFVKCAHAYEERGGRQRGSFDRYLRYRVRRELLSRARVVARRQADAAGSPHVLPVAEPADTGFDLPTFRRELSADAKAAVDAAFGPGVPAEGNVKALRRAVKACLGAMGWPAARVAAAFAEIREALA